MLTGLMPFIEAILLSDRQAPCKQRHAAHRIWQRIKAERLRQTVAALTAFRDALRHRRKHS